MKYHALDYPQILDFLVLDKKKSGSKNCLNNMESEFLSGSQCAKKPRRRPLKRSVSPLPNAD